MNRALGTSVVGTVLISFKKRFLLHKNLLSDLRDLCLSEKKDIEYVRLNERMSKSTQYLPKRTKDKVKVLIGKGHQV